MTLNEDWIYGINVRMQIYIMILSKFNMIFTLSFFFVFSNVHLGSSQSMTGLQSSVSGLRCLQYLQLTCVESAGVALNSFCSLTSMKLIEAIDSWPLAWVGSVE